MDSSNWIVILRMPVSDSRQRSSMAKPTPDDPKAAPSPGESSQATAGGAAPAKAPEAPLRSDEAQGVAKRRSDRVVVAIPIDLSATDLNGVRFTESCFTEMVSLHGASVALSKRASPEHPVTLRRRALEVEVSARILGQLGIRPGFHVYGIAFTDEALDFWGIRFPPLDQSHDSLAQTLLMCSECGKRLIFTLNEIEFRVFNANQRLSFGCETCGHNVAWIPVPNEAKLAYSSSGTTQPHNRKYSRTQMKALACIQESGHSDDIVEVLDISRGGVSFRGTRAYQVQSWIHFAVPYTPGTANIFVSGRVAWRRDLDDDQYEHGVQYVKG